MGRMLRISVMFFVLVSLALAEEFTFAIGSPVASQNYRFKTAAFVFRTEGCADPAKSQITGTAEGIVKGARRSVALTISPLPQPGVYGVFQTWPKEGEWVVSLKGTCGDARAGAIVPMDLNGFVRESSKFFPRAATDSEIETSLKALAQGGNK